MDIQPLFEMFLCSLGTKMMQFSQVVEIVGDLYIIILYTIFGTFAKFVGS